MPTAYFPSKPARAPRAQGLFNAEDFARQRAFFGAHRSLEPTPLRCLPALASELDIGQILIKDETRRFGLPAFKGVGIEFALDALRARGALAEVTTLVCASEGNHGRAVASAARRAGLGARVYLASRVAEARAAAIAEEGARVVRVPGAYEDAVRAAAAEAEARADWLVISDTSWPGYEAVPREIMLGYTRLMDEAAAAWADAPPDVLFVQAGVGGLLGAVASWLASAHLPTRPGGRPLLFAVEPAGAACVQASARAGHPVSLSGPLHTNMGGLRCGEVSPCAFPAIFDLVDAYLAIEDIWAEEAMRCLARPFEGDVSMAVGPSGAAGLGALLAVKRSPHLAAASHALGLDRESRVFAIATEGPTEPGLWEAVTDLSLA